MQSGTQQFYASMKRIQDAISAGLLDLGVRMHPKDFHWNSDAPLVCVPERVTLRVQLGPYRNFEEVFTREQVELGTKDPTVRAFVVLAVARLTGGRMIG